MKNFIAMILTCVSTTTFASSIRVQCSNPDQSIYLENGFDRFIVLSSFGPDDGLVKTRLDSNQFQALEKGRKVIEKTHNSGKCDQHLGVRFHSSKETYLANYVITVDENAPIVLDPKNEKRTINTQLFCQLEITGMAPCQ